MHTYSSSKDHYSLGVSADGTHYLVVRGESSDAGDSYRLTIDQYEQFITVPERAVQFAQECRTGGHAELIIVKPAPRSAPTPRGAGVLTGAPEGMWPTQAPGGATPRPSAQ